MNDTDRIKQRIAKLLALAEDGSATEGEVANAMAFAAALMEQHHIDADDARKAHAAAGHAERVTFAQQGAYTSGSRMAAWESMLAEECRALCGVKHYEEHGVWVVKTTTGTVAYDDKGQSMAARKIVFYGEAGDVADAVALYTEWRTTIAAMARLRYGGALKGEGAAYAEGFVQGMRRARRDRAAAPATTALAVRSTAIVAAKQNAAHNWLTTDPTGPRLKLRTGSGRSGSSAGNGDAHAAGRRDGSNATMSRRGRVSGTTGGGTRALT